MSVFHVEFDFNLSVWFESDRIFLSELDTSKRLKSRFIRKFSTGFNCLHYQRCKTYSITRMCVKWGVTLCDIKIF